MGTGAWAKSGERAIVAGRSHRAGAEQNNRAGGFQLRCLLCRVRGRPAPAPGAAASYQGTGYTPGRRTLAEPDEPSRHLDAKPTRSEKAPWVAERRLRGRAFGRAARPAKQWPQALLTGYVHHSGSKGEGVVGPLRTALEH